MVQSEMIKEIFTDTTQKIRRKSKINLNYSPELLKKCHSTSIKKPLMDSASSAMSQQADNLDLTKIVCCFECNLRLKKTKFSAESLECLDESPQLPIGFHVIICKLIQRSIFKFLLRLCFTIAYTASFLGMIFLLKNGFKLKDSFSIPDTNINNSSLNYTTLISSIKCTYCYLNIWLTTSVLVLVWPGYIILWLFDRRWINSNTKSSVTNVITQKPKNLRNLIVTSFRSFYIMPKHNQKELVGPTRNRLKSDFFFKIFLITGLWLITGYNFLSALNLIRISDVLIIYSIHLSLSYMIRWIALHSKFIPMRLLGFISSIAAIIFTFYSKGSHVKILDVRMLGNVCAIIAASGSAILQVIWKNATKNLTSIQRTLLTTLIGLCNILFGWPLLVLFHFTDVESLSFLTNPIECLSTKWRVISYFLFAFVLGLIYTFLIQFRPVWLNCNWVHISSLIAIPVTFGNELIQDKYHVSGMRMQAFFCSCLSYFLILIPEDLGTNFRNYFCAERETNTKPINSLTRRYAKATAQSPDL